MQKSNIEWTKFASNPIKGKCKHFGTPICGKYCYVQTKMCNNPKIRELYGKEEPSWHPDELATIERRRKPATIFMGSMYDLFGEWVPTEAIAAIIQTAIISPQHTFLFLTKNPKRYSDFYFPDNCWTGATVTNMDSWYPTTKRSFVSLEPLMMQLPPAAVPMIVGAMTGPGAVKPKKEWVEHILKYAQQPVFLKNNLLSLFPDLPRRQETAWAL